MCGSRSTQQSQFIIIIMPDQRYAKLGVMKSLSRTDNGKSLEHEVNSFAQRSNTFMIVSSPSTLCILSAMMVMFVHSEEQLKAMLCHVRDT